ncbi:membrane protein insertase YidC [Acidimangrovimonas sediminis]|uniref:membrane protein insertase YidC n=1 Tax=Acidimangrovimonas sediminis TaxID=2056283 RepID=UPI000C808A92|nr:membrane protein insertase YidC [Acidimangrovimonas sediminis]
MDDQNKNLILATALSLLVILAWFWLFPQPEPSKTAQDKGTATQTAAGNDQSTAKSDGAAATQPAETGTSAPAPQAGSGTDAAASVADRVAKLPRIKIETPTLEGSISTLGGRIDSLKLKDYRETVDKNSPLVELLSPAGSPDPYYAVYGWAPGNGLTGADVPGPNTVWTAPAGATLSPGHPVTMTWKNDKGLTFERTLAIDDKYMFTVTQKVVNTGTAAARLAPYGIVARHGIPKGKMYYLLFEGAYQMADGKLEEMSYKDLSKAGAVNGVGDHVKQIPGASTGWTGITSKYFMTALVPDQGKKATQTAQYVNGSDIYQVSVQEPTQSVAPGKSVETTTRLFAGAKVYDILKGYEKQGVPRFIDAIDWGWFFFLTKPIFLVLHFIHGIVGNMGLAIILLTVTLKIIVFPLAYKSYVSMARMKELQPEIEKLKEKAGDDRAKLQKEMMGLYKEKKVNPAAGCLPILIQIPIFFSLYKVIYVTIELRHAAFIGWIRDLSSPDPSSILNLFGLLPWNVPPVDSPIHIISLGVLPILLGISMWLQQKLNPAPADPTQKMIFAWMPWVFMFMLGSFPSGLVLYWITNNTITFTQQYIIMRSHGAKPDVFGNIRSGFNRKKKAEGK